MRELNRRTNPAQFRSLPCFFAFDPPLLGHLYDHARWLAVQLVEQLGRRLGVWRQLDFPAH